MSKKNKGHGEAHENHERWLLTYADMMNNLLILFMMLYAISSIDLQKYKNVSQGLTNALSPSSTAQSKVTSTASNSDAPELTNEEKPKNFDELYDALKNKVKQTGFETSVTIEKGNDFIRIQFKDSVLFNADSSVMKTNNMNVLKGIGDVVKSIDGMINSIEIGGHTASTGGYTDSFFAWELSSDRAIAVLSYLVRTCNLPESKMTVSGYSKYKPISANDTEDGRSSNRRVEIKITKSVSQTAETQTKTTQSTTQSSNH